MPSAAIVWFQRDLRLDDNPALWQACASHDIVIPVFIAGSDDDQTLGAPSRWWLSRSLHALDASLRKACNRLVVRRGHAARELLDLCAESGAGAVYWNRRYEPAAVAASAAVERALGAAGVAARTSDGALLRDPSLSAKADGTPYRVFTPFWRALMSKGSPEQPLASPAAIPPPPAWLRSLRIDDLHWQGDEACSRRLTGLWRPGESGARATWTLFLDRLAAYSRDRDRLDRSATSRLSPHVAAGEISVRQLWHVLHDLAERRPALSASVQSFVRQLVWREFAYHLLYHLPEAVEQPLREEFVRFPWRQDEAGLQAWQRGCTGYPIVDAAMRELSATGWMHNRARMIVASFLVKDLMLPWQHGARWFEKTLVDADLANNTLGWQWVSGCGADAAPFFRIFNPTLQARKFDPDGTYVRRWLPALEYVPTSCVHEPWKAPASVLASAGVRLGIDYPEPIVSHEMAKRSALAAYKRLTAGGDGGE
ncbi:MAG TPA: deoxyribodipyrimidine photo-lyase [Candidatus Limnocylindrales bacterium]|nr:deoxyribodipyrimidine photo-lyase [Candidatus Limnocylindrales bacterium]